MNLDKNEEKNYSKKEISKNKKNVKYHNKEKSNFEQEKEKSEDLSIESAKNSISSIDSLEDFDNLISNFDSKVEKKSITHKNIEKNSNKINSSINNKVDSVPNEVELFDDYIIKEIIGDGNCFYRAICYFYREKQEEYNEFRQLIVQYFDNHPDQYIATVLMKILIF